TLNDIKQALIDHNVVPVDIEKFSHPILTEWTLNGVKPDRYVLRRPDADPHHINELSVYVFKSEKERQEAHKELTNLITNNDTLTVYYHHNILLLYTYQPNNEGFYGYYIEKALENQTTSLNSVDEYLHAFSSQGMEVFKTDTTKLIPENWSLGGVLPEYFTVGSPLGISDQNDELALYQFDSETAKDTAMQELNTLIKEDHNVSIYTYKNNIFAYWFYPVDYSEDYFKNNLIDAINTLPGAKIERSQETNKHLSKITGYILEIEPNKILLAQNMTLEAYHLLTDLFLTELLILESTPQLMYLDYEDASSFDKGDYVTATISGGIETSLPAQAGASKIEKLDSFDPISIIKGYSQAVEKVMFAKLDDYNKFIDYANMAEAVAEFAPYMDEAEIESFLERHFIYEQEDGLYIYGSDYIPMTFQEDVPYSLNKDSDTQYTLTQVQYSEF